VQRVRDRAIPVCVCVYVCMCVCVCVCVCVCMCVEEWTQMVDGLIPFLYLGLYQGICGSNWGIYSIDCGWVDSIFVYIQYIFYVCRLNVYQDYTVSIWGYKV
jgi:hypothetical protein